MITNIKNYEKEQFFFLNKKDDLSKISLNSNEMSTHSNVKEPKYNTKIFKIQKYVKSGKFENKILSDEEFSEKETLKEEHKKKISPYSKVNFSKLRNKEKIQRYLMMRKLVNKLNCKLKSMEKLVGKNPCSLLDKLAKIKISKMEKLCNKPKRELNDNKTFEEFQEFKFENLVKAAKKLYFHEDFEFCEEKNLLNLLFKVFDNEKINLNSLHLNEIMKIIRSIKENNQEKNFFEEKINKKSFIKLSRGISNNISDSIDHLNLELNESNIECEDYALINLKLKVKDKKETLKPYNEDLQSLQIQNTQKNLNIIKNPEDKNDILTIKFNQDEKKNFNYNIKRNNLERCELKFNNNCDAFHNKNKKIKLISKEKNLQTKYLNYIHEDFICDSDSKIKDKLSRKNIKTINNVNNERTSFYRTQEQKIYKNESTMTFDMNKEKVLSRKDEINEPYHLQTNPTNTNDIFNFKSYLLNILNENILKTNRVNRNHSICDSIQEHNKECEYKEKALNSVNHTELFKENTINPNQLIYENSDKIPLINYEVYNHYLNCYFSNFINRNINSYEAGQTSFINENSNNMLLNNNALDNHTMAEQLKNEFLSLFSKS